MEETITITWKKVCGNSTRRIRTFNYVSFFCALLVLLSNTGRAQEKDSLAIYRKIRCLAEQHRFTNWMYQAIFVEPATKEYPVEPTKYEGEVVNPYLKYNGRVIRKVSITVLDPFGYSVNDTTRRKTSWLEKTGNHAHVTTRNWVIDNKLLFKENDKLDALSISETERLLRQAVYVSDARIFVKPVGKDSADVQVMVQDKWSITIPAEITNTSGNARFRDENVLGTGQQLEQYVGFRTPNRWNYNGFFNVANIDHTYISSLIGYNNTKDGTAVNLAFDRPFYSPLASWAGGIYLSHAQRFYEFDDAADNKEKQINLVNVGYDGWYGRSIKLGQGKGMFNQSNNIILAGRYYGSHYIKRPQADFDVKAAFPNTHAFVGNIGFALQQYYKDKYIYRFGANEDVPEGLILQYLYGGIKSELSAIRYYSGIELARAKHFDIGYFSATISYSVFFNRHMTNDVTTGYKLYYFSDLIRMGRWYLRQFVNGNVVYGTHKLPAEKLTLTSDDLYGFSSGTLRGNSKLVFQSQTVAYAPYNVVGFKFAPVFSAAIGMVGDDQQKILNSSIYQGYSLGLMLRNENLLVSTFQFSFGLYPYLPNGGTNVLKYNPITSFTLRVRAFSISKPGFISY